VSVIRIDFVSGLTPRGCVRGYDLCMFAHVCMFVCMYVYMYVCVGAVWKECGPAYVCVCMYVCMHVCLYVD
jgi:hypothetical protein